MIFYNRCFCLIAEYVAYEQVFVAALDCNRIDVANECLHALSAEFPESLRIYKLQVMKLEAQERLVSYMNNLQQNKACAHGEHFLQTCYKTSEMFYELPS